MKRIPFVPLSIDKAKKITRRFLGIGENLSRMFPNLDFQLRQTKVDMEPREWMAIAFYAGLTYFALVFAVLFIYAVKTFALLQAVLLSGGFGFLVGLITMVYIAMYPKLFVSRNIRDIDSFLPQALHHLLVQVRSGITLYDSMVSIARSNYGMVSKIFRQSVNEINTGKSEIEALEYLARENPSLYFRRVLWQMINALKSGSDIGDTIKNIVDNLVLEQRVAIKKYGAQLNPLALFYMVLVVIFPTLGIIFLLVLFSFIGTLFNIELILIGILGFITIFQFMFMGLIKSKRPPGI
ncbi:MAG: type II secretion system F family protein [Candidatus Aenigmatarchaeota archaeon]|nr:type II secretion system F family protein [Nanoarchaeota archaeon]